MRLATVPLRRSHALGRPARSAGRSGEDCRITAETVGTRNERASFDPLQVWAERSQVSRERIVVVGLLTQLEVEMLGHGLSRLWPVDDSPCFSELLKRIDEADRQLGHESRSTAGTTLKPKRSRADAESVPPGGRC